MSVGEILDAGRDVLLSDSPILVNIDEGCVPLELAEATLLLHLLLQELGKHIDGHTESIWSDLASIRHDLRQPSEKLVCVDVVLLEEEGQSADDRFERIVIFVRSLADFVKEVHIIQKTKFVLV